MDRRERAPESLESLMVFGERLRSEIWTALPGIIQSFDPAKQTCTVQPAIQAQVSDLSGNLSWVNLPLLVDCPVFFPSGGGVTLTFPLAVDDECLVIFANRCIDAWWQLGGIQVQAEFRMHDLSDGMVLPGFDSVPKVIPSVSTTGAQLRNQSGNTYVEVANGGTIKIIAGSSVTVTAPGITINGPTTINGTLAVNGAITGSSTITAPNVVGSTNVTFGGKSGIAHTHGGVQPGSGTSGGPS